MLVLDTKQLQRTFLIVMNSSACQWKYNIARLDQGNGITATLVDQEAKWHKCCYLKDNKCQFVETTQTFAKKNFTRRNACSVNQNATEVQAKCFFCDKGDTEGKLHEVCTFQLDYHVCKSAYDLQDEKHLAKLNAGDLIAIEAKYHAKCLAELYNKARCTEMKEEHDSNDKTCHGIALAELISYIEDCRKEDKVCVFTLADVTKLYTHRLEQLGSKVTT